MYCCVQFFLALKNCVDAITDSVSDEIGVIAGVSIAVAVLLVRCYMHATYIHVYRAWY